MFVMSIKMSGEAHTDEQIPQADSYLPREAKKTDFNSWLMKLLT